MNYKIEKKDGKIYVTVTVPPMGTHREQKPRYRIKKRHVLDALRERNVVHGKCITDPGHVLNFDGPPFILSKTWIFEDIPTAKPPTKPKTSTRKTPTRKRSPKRKEN